MTSIGRRKVANGIGMVVGLLLAFGIAGGRAAGENRAEQIVRQDWYFRETLPAIRDWEAILGQWESKTPEAERTPILPVPRSGQAVTWPNPIPRLLLPVEDLGRRVEVRLQGDKVEVVHRAADGSADRRLSPAHETIVGYKHPGGGGKDQWYHHYTRRFDRMTAFRVQPSAFSVDIPAPLDLLAGTTELEVALRSFAAAPAEITVRVRQYTAPRLGSSQPTATELRLALPAGGAQTVKLPIALAAAGGGLAVLEVHDATGCQCRLPIFTYVEDLAAVLAGLGRMLEEVSDAAGRAQFAELCRRSAGGPRPGTQWRMLFDEASRLRDRLLLARIPYDAILFLKRKPFFSEQPFMDAHHLYNRPGGGIFRLSPVRPGGTVTKVVDSLGEGVYRDLCVHWEAERVLFSFGNGSDDWKGGPSYHLFEARIDGGGVRQLTLGPKNDCEPIYLADDRILFTSDRSEHFVMCGGDRHVANLFTMNADGAQVRQLSHNVFNEFTPALLPDGRILYSRWEYNERSVTSLHKLFTIHPDGTHPAPYYGNATIRPNVTMYARPTPEGTVMALFTAHHGQTHGPIGVIDIRHGIDGPAPVTVLTPGVPVSGERVDDSFYGWYSEPWPLGGDAYLCSFTPTVQPWLEKTWALYVGDRHGNLALVYRDESISCAEPTPIARRQRPAALAFAPVGPGPAAGEATLILVDVYQGLPGVERGTIASLRVLEDLPRVGVQSGGVIVTAATGIYTAKRILGTVPVEPDGSAWFRVPADRNLYFQALDEGHREVQRMRSVVCLKPNEQRTCGGCHDPRTQAPLNRAALALAKAPRPIEPYPWGTGAFSYLRDVQPVLNARCVKCHTHDRAGNAVVLTGELTEQFCVSYEELLPYASTANAMRWDNPEDVYPRPPYTYGSGASPLVDLLAKGHHGVELGEEERLRIVCWIDTNAVYYDRYECGYSQRRLFAEPVRRAAGDVYARRCQQCHGTNSDGKHDTWWLSVNHRDVTKSRGLAAPLARSAGGWGRCAQTVFADTSDADYRKLLGILTGVVETLERQPREDLLTLRASAAAAQPVEIPEPPAPARRSASYSDASGEWRYLSALPWESAASGWTPNRDGLPRRDRDIENRPLRLARRTYRKGLGTHAPSAIVYRLAGKYQKLHAVVGGAEKNGTVVFQVYGDERLLFDSGRLEGLGEVRPVDISITGVDKLRLVVTDAGDHYYSDEANWADARVLLAP